MRHEALLYGSTEEYIEAVLAFLNDALIAGEPVFIAIPGHKADLFRESMNLSAERIQFADMTRLGQNPSRIIPAIRQFADDHIGCRVRIVGEPIWPGQNSTAVAEATRHEALINLAFAQTAIVVLCPYDRQGLDPAVIADAARTHPAIVENGIPRYNSHFTDPVMVCDPTAWPLSAPPDNAVVMNFDPSSLVRLRRLVSQQATTAGLTSEHIANLLLAINEVATNTLIHSSGLGTLRIWQEPGTFVCEMHDTGCIRDPLAGRRRPATDAKGGRGLWLINHLCDLVEIRSDGNGTTIRMHISY